MIKWLAILGIVTAIGGGIVWYTHMIASHARDLQAASDQQQIMQQSLDHQVSLVEQFKKQAKEKDRQIRLRDKVYHQLAAESETLEAELAEVSSEQQRECGILPVDGAVIVRLFGVFPQGHPIASPDGISEAVSGDGTVPADSPSDL